MHFEVKVVERLNIEDAMDQARRDAAKGGMANGKWRMAQVPVVTHKRNFRPWLVTMEAETFFQFLRGALPVLADCHRSEREITEATNQKGNQNNESSS
jgi:hypothetical protein